MGVAAGAVMLIAAAYVLMRSRGVFTGAENPLAGAVARSASDSETSLERAGRLLLEAAQPLGVDAVPTDDVLDNVGGGA